MKRMKVWLNQLKERLPWSISFKLAASLSLIVLVLVLFSHLTTYFYFNRVLTEENLKKDSYVLEQDARQLESYFQELTGVAQNILSDAEIQQFCRLSDPDFFAREQAAETLSRYVSLKHSLHSAVLITDAGTLWSLFPIDETFDQLIGQDWYAEDSYGYSAPFELKNGRTSLRLIAYRTVVYDLRSPQEKIGELLINLDAAQLERLIHAWNKPQDEISLVHGREVLIASSEKLNEEHWNRADMNMNTESRQTFADGTLLIQAVPGTPYALISFRSRSFLKERTGTLIGFFVLFTLLIGILVMLTLTRAVRGITAPIRLLSAGMEQFAAGDMCAHVEVHSHDELERLSANFNDMVASIHRLLNQAVEDEKIKKKLKFDMMISKIHPHFIYNTLNSVIVMAKKQGNDDVVQMVRALILILQDGMAVHEDLLTDTIRTECGVIEAYAAIQNFRYKNKFTIEYDVDPELEEVLIAKNILQPLVENAIFHGLLPKPGPGHIRLAIHRRPDQRLSIRLEDDGVGLDEELATQIEKGAEALRGHRSQQDSVHSIALVNVLERLEFLYGSRMSFHVHSSPGKGTAFDLEVPELREKGGGER